MKKLQIGVIGAGGIANGIHFPILSRMEQVQLKAVCDLKLERAVAAKETYRFKKAYTSIHELLANETLDAALVLTEPDALFRATRTCLIAGLHVFMEKPMGVTAYQAQTLADVSREYNRTLHVGYNRRYLPLVKKVLELVKETSEITLAEGRFYKNSSPAFYGGCGSAFTCDVVHVVDLVRHAVGKSVNKAATLEGNHPDSGIPETWHSIFRFENGAAGIVRSHYRTGGRVHDFEFHGEGVSAFVDLGSPNSSAAATIIRAKGIGQQSLSAMGSSETETIRLDGKTLAESDRYEDYYGYRDEMNQFMGKVLENQGYDALRTEEDLASAKLVEQLLAARI